MHSLIKFLNFLPANYVLRISFREAASLILAYLWWRARVIAIVATLQSSIFRG